MPDSIPYEIVGDPRAGGPFVFTCEHATRLVPEWDCEPEDRPVLEDHWGWDIGAADLTRALVELTGSFAVLSRFSRLVCDPNRHPGEASFVVQAIDGTPIESPDDVLSMYEKIKSGSNISIQITRRGRQKTINYEMR